MTRQNPFRSAWGYYRELYFAAAAYAAFITFEAWLLEVPFAQYIRIIWAMQLVAAKCLMLVAGMGAVVFIKAFFTGRGGPVTRWRAASQHLSQVARAYTDGEVFAYACIGVPVLFGLNFFFIQKSLIQFINYYSWDPVFAAWDRLVHFGRYPHEFLIPFTMKFHLGRFFDIVYYLWFVVLYLGLGYNLFLDTDVRRRLRFYWVFFLSWVIIGSAMATWLASVGPLFFNNFYPVLEDPYTDLVAHFDAVGEETFPISFFSRKLLLFWTTNGQMVNINALSAMPSLHVAIAWLMVLYAATIGRAWMAAAFAFCVTILAGSVYFGYHYAVDGYISIAAVSFLWWGVGKALDRRYPADAKPLKRL